MRRAEVEPASADSISTSRRQATRQLGRICMWLGILRGRTKIQALAPGAVPLTAKGLSLIPSTAAKAAETIMPSKLSSPITSPIGNGGRGVEVFNNKSGSSHAPVFLEHNTTWHNNNATNQNWSGCGEIQIGSALNVTATLNLAMASSSTGCGSNTIYSFSVENANGTVTVNNNWGHAAAGTAGFIFNSSGFSYGSANVFSTDPGFANPSTPGAPSCAGFANVPACMATMISNFRPTASGASAYGYQTPLTTNASDPLFPQWLCNVNLPTGLVTMGCGTSSSLPAPPTNISATVR